ncbi:MAG: hypothetical protein H0Z35_04190 [Thermoanaerobacteraceae bacterium]|nr:hypothetical protein [Thermoanaerobacteraceae bacterium]
MVKVRVSDIERKMFIMIRNSFHTSGRPLTIKEFGVRTGRTKKKVKEVLETLVEKKNIRWAGEEIELLREYGGEGR